MYKVNQYTLHTSSKLIAQLFISPTSDCLLHTLVTSVAITYITTPVIFQSLVNTWNKAHHFITHSKIIVTYRVATNLFVLTV